METEIVSALARFGQRRGFLADVSSHQAVYSTDTFWRHIAQISRKVIWWGVPHRPGGTRGGGSGDTGSVGDDTPSEPQE